MDDLDPQLLVRILCSGVAVALLVIAVQLVLSVRRGHDRSPNFGRIAWTLAVGSFCGAAGLLGYAWLPVAMS